MVLEKPLMFSAQHHADPDLVDDPAEGGDDGAMTRNGFPVR